MIEQNVIYGKIIKTTSEFIVVRCFLLEEPSVVCDRAFYQTGPFCLKFPSGAKKGDYIKLTEKITPGTMLVTVVYADYNDITEDIKRQIKDEETSGSDDSGSVS